MRFIGSKISLLKEIESILPTYIKGQTFCDIFSGTACVARYFKQKYKIISNDFTIFFLCSTKSLFVQQ
ncbi:DNA adenine methylase [Helicobacter pylori]